MNKLGPVKVGRSHPVRVMGILNTSPESFYKKSIKKGKEISYVIQQMEQDGADFIDVGGMSTAPYISTLVSEKEETRRIVKAIKQIQNKSNLPISVDTCRATVAKAALEYGIDIINDISGLKYDPQMIHVIEKYRPSLILCAYSKLRISGNNVKQTKLLLKQSMALAMAAKIKKANIVLDPAIGFFRKTGKNPFYTKIKTDWLTRDLEILQNLPLMKLDQPTLISVSNKSFIGAILNCDPEDRIFGSIAAETLAVINGVNVIRTHNIKQTNDALCVIQKLTKQFRKGL